MILLVLMSFILIAGYVFAMIKRWRKFLTLSVTPTMPLTHKFWFGLCMIGSGALLLPAAFEASTENSQFLVFLSVVGMIVLGVSPNFKGSQKTAHCIGAAMSLIFSQIWVGCNSWYWLLLWAGFIAYMVISMSEHWTGNFISDFIKKKADVLDRGNFVVNRLSNLYRMKEAIVHTTTGGFAAIATAFVAESLQNMIPWLIVSCAVILCDLLFGVRKSMLMGEKGQILTCDPCHYGEDGHLLRFRLHGLHD